MQSFKSQALAVLKIEAEAVQQLEQFLNEDFDQACNLILQNTGKVIVSGIGKSGHIANKIAATFASTGTPAFFVHPGEGQVIKPRRAKF